MSDSKAEQIKTISLNFSTKNNLTGAKLKNEVDKLN